MTAVEITSRTAKPLCMSLLDFKLNVIILIEYRTAFFKYYDSMLIFKDVFRVLRSIINQR